jgi:hypothetical protein
MSRGVRRHRPEPRKPSVYGLLVAAFLLILSVTVLDGWAAILVGLLAVLNAGVFLVMHFRRAAWLVTTGADQELGR